MKFAPHTDRWHWSPRLVRALRYAGAALTPFEPAQPVAPELAHSDSMTAEPHAMEQPDAAAARHALLEHYFQHQPS